MEKAQNGKPQSHLSQERPSARVCGQCCVFICAVCVHAVHVCSRACPAVCVSVLCVHAVCMSNCVCVQLCVCVSCVFPTEVGPPPRGCMGHGVTFPRCPPPSSGRCGLSTNLVRTAQAWSAQRVRPEPAARAGRVPECSPSLGDAAAGHPWDTQDRAYLAKVTCSSWHCDS